MLANNHIEADFAEDSSQCGGWPSLWSCKDLQKASTQLKLLRPRSLAWALLLEVLPSSHCDVLNRLRQHRSLYEELRKKFTKDPRAVVGDDPLSQKDESVWKQHFADNELKALILQDVMRTFPEELYFRDKNVQDLMVRVLFVWARSHELGYRQGMHEILAPLLQELHEDRKYCSVHPSVTPEEILKPEYLEHDCHMLFCGVMRGLERFYTTGNCVPSACGRLPTSTSIHKPSEVVRYLEQVRSEHLVPLDPDLADHLHRCNISLELFGIRWLRLLFGREFPRADVPLLWGFLFSEGPTLPNLHYILLATLISMRDHLLDPDPGVVLSALMRPAHAAGRVAHVVALALHLREPLLHPRPTTPPPTVRHVDEAESLEETGTVSRDSAMDEGVAEGADVARELATLALLRAQLPVAAAALVAALPRRPLPNVARPLSQILQLSAILQCRNHALVDVETALEAAEGQAPGDSGRRRLVPVGFGPPPPQHRKSVRKQTKDVPLKVFNQIECAGDGSLPNVDPLRLRTE